MVHMQYIESMDYDYNSLYNRIKSSQLSQPLAEEVIKVIQVLLDENRRLSKQINSSGNYISY
jgi:hypothetical protein